MLQVADEQQTEMTDELTGLIDASNQRVDAATARSDAELKLARTELGVLLLLAVALAVVMGRLIAGKIAAPLGMLSAAVEKLATGDVDVSIEVKGGDECGTLADAFRKLVESIREKAREAEQIAKGNIEIEVYSAGEKDTLAKSYTQMLASLRFMVQQVKAVATATRQGQLDLKLDAGDLKGVYRELVQELNEGVGKIAVPLSISVTHLENLSQGINGQQITREYSGQILKLREGFNQTFSTIESMADDVRKLASAAQEGNFDLRADASKHKGIFREIVEGVNRTLDSMIKPVQEGNRILRQIRGGNLRERVEIECKGDHQTHERRGEWRPRVAN